MIIAAMKQMLLTIVSTGKDKMKWGKVKKFYTYSSQMAKYSDKISGQA